MVGFQRSTADDLRGFWIGLLADRVLHALPHAPQEVFALSHMLMLVPMLSPLDPSVGLRQFFAYHNAGSPSFTPPRDPQHVSFLQVTTLWRASGMSYCCTNSQMRL